MSICLPEYVCPRIAMRRSMDARCHKLSPELQQPLLPCHGAPTSAKPLKLSIGRDGEGHSAWLGLGLGLGLGLANPNPNPNPNP